MVQVQGCEIGVRSEWEAGENVSGLRQNALQSRQLRGPIAVPIAVLRFPTLSATKSVMRHRQPFQLHRATMQLFSHSCGRSGPE